LATGKPFSGIGFAITDGYVLIDLDECRDPKAGTIEEWAQFIVDFLHCPTEISPSGTGLHIYVKSQNGTCLKSLKRVFNTGEKRGIEIYASGRYSTVSFNHLPGTPLEIPEFDLTQFITFVERGDFDPDDVRQAVECKPNEREANRVIAPALTAPALTALDLGNWVSTFRPDVIHSKPDGTLLVACPGTHGEYDKRDGRAFLKQMPSGALTMGCLHSTCSMFNGTGNHWQEFRQTVEGSRRTREINSLPPEQRTAGEPKEKAAGTIVSPFSNSLVVVRGSEVKREHLEYLWNPYLPKGKLVHLGGNSGQGKSPVTVDWIARITTGADWPDGTPNTLGPRSVLLMNIEDSLQDTILPRLDLAKGDSSRLFYVRATRVAGKDKDSSSETSVALDRDILLLSEQARKTEDLALIVIDPITNYLGRLSMNKEEEIRAVLSPLAALADELKVTIITVGHFNRRERGTDPLHRMMGAAAFSGVARVVYAVGPDPDSENEHAHVMTQVRGATGVTQGLKYHTEMVEVPWEGKTSGVIRVGWDGTTTANADDAVDSMSRQEKSQLMQAAAVLRDFLASGKRPAAECQSFLKENGFDPEKLNAFKIRRRANAGSQQSDRKHWWYLL
jgi:hypothetical protein